jgi:predicted small lipoprotein YifL
LLAATALLALAGCGSKPYDLSSTTKVQPAAVRQPSADTAGTSYTVCIEGIGFQTTRTTETDGLHIQTQVPSGRTAANSTVFSTAEEAKRFDKKVTEPDHVRAGRVVTVLVPDVASYTERQALLRCAPEG